MIKRLIILGIAAILGVATGVEGAQVYTPPSTGELTITAPGTVEITVARWPTKTLYVRDGTGRNQLALRAEKDISQLDIGDIAVKRNDLAAMHIVRVDSLGDPLIADSFAKLTFGAPSNPGPGKQVMAIAWLVAIGLIGIATVGRRKQL
jgi:hypothetical protein